MQTPKLLPMVLVATGMLLIWSAVKDKSPQQTLKDALNQKAMANGTPATNHPTSNAAGASGTSAPAKASGTVGGPVPASGAQRAAGTS